GRRRAPASRLFPYTTLFRSERRRAGALRDRAGHRSRVDLDRSRGAVEEDLRIVARPPRTRGRRWRDERGDARVPAKRRGAELYRSEEHTSELQSRENLVCRL